jgi:hypothetical protein
MDSSLIVNASIMYEVKFANETWHLDSDELLLEFVKTAVIRNKDVSSFSVKKVLKTNNKK